MCTDRAVRREREHLRAEGGQRADGFGRGWCGEVGRRVHPVEVLAHGGERRAVLVLPDALDRDLVAHAEPEQEAVRERVGERLPDRCHGDRVAAVDRGDARRDDDPLGAGEDERGVHEGVAPRHLREPQRVVPELLELGRDLGHAPDRLGVEAAGPDPDASELHHAILGQPQVDGRSWRRPPSVDPKREPVLVLAGGPDAAVQWPRGGATLRTTLSGDDTYQLLIGGEWVPGGDGAYPIVNPATEAVVADAPEASADQAARCSRGGPGSVPRRGRRRSPPSARALLQAAADELKKRVPDFVPLVIEETGATTMVAKSMQVPTAAARFERYAAGAMESARHPARAPGGAGNTARARRSHGCARPAGARRSGRVHHVVQLPDRQHGRQARPRARDGQHRRRAPRGPGPARRHRDRQAARGRRLPARRREHRHRFDPGLGSGPRRVAGHRHGELHGLDQRRHADR